MPIISKVGARSFKVRLAYGIIFGVLILGAVTMVYPFMLMLAGSTKSEADIARIAPYPQFWFDDTTLFQKYVESKYNVDLTLAARAWSEPIGNWTRITPPEASPHLEDFLAWRQTDACRWWWVGHSGGGRMLPKNARRFRELMYDRFNGSLDAFNKAMGLPLKSWNTVLPPIPILGLRYPRERHGLFAAFEEYSRDVPARDRVIGNPDGMFLNEYLRPTYTNDIAEYNARHGTNYAGYHEVFLARRPPNNRKQREDWEEFVREILPLQYVRLSERASDRYRAFLAEKYGGIAEYNRRRGGAEYASFDEVPLPRELPKTRLGMVDWQEFVSQSKYCPIEYIEVYGPRQSFEEFVAKRRGIPPEKLGPIRLPIPQADWHDCMTNATSIRWEFTTRNYKQVLGYLLTHGRGIPNTLIYCTLAITLSLVVNPLAAYALSRYKPPSTYTVLLFCMATMAFPGEVTMIPAFLLLKRFPLWPLVGGAAAFGVAVWLLSKMFRNLPELLRMTIALAVGVLVGAWAVPAAIGRPHISLLNTFAALVLPGMANGYMIFLLKGFFDSLPRELYEAADIDGASEWTKFWSFTMALSKPILAVLALGAFTMAYTNFMMALIIIPDQDMWTMMVWLFQLQTESHQAVNYASVVMAAIPTFLVFVVCQGIIIRGIVVPTEK